MAALLQENTSIEDLKESTQIKQRTKWVWWIFIGVFIVIAGILYKIQKSKKAKLSENQENETQSGVTTLEKLPINVSTILEKLTDFEKSEGFLQDDLTLDDLARKINSNRTTVSLVIAKHKDGFNTYIYKLRIDFIVECLEKDPNLRIQNIENIALKAGFKNRKTFTTVFKENKNIAFSEFLEELRKT